MPSDRPTEQGFTRRGFLQTVGIGAPSVALVLEGVPARAQAPPSSDTGKSTPIDLGRFFNCSSRDFGAREEVRQAGGESAKDGFLRAPSGRRSLRGLPFVLGPLGLDARQWVRLSTRPGPATTPRIEVPLGQPARFVCLAAFCDWPAPRRPRRGRDARPARSDAGRGGPRLRGRHGEARAAAPSLRGVRTDVPVGQPGLRRGRPPSGCAAQALRPASERPRLGQPADGRDRPRLRR